MSDAGNATRRALLAIAALAILWALAVYVTGGIAIDTRWRPISSRNPLRPLVAGLVAAAWYAYAWRRYFRRDLAPLAVLTQPPAIGVGAAGVALVIGLGWGSTIAGGPDPSGYVSQAAMFARGDLTANAPRWAQNAAWDDAAYTASPVGWHPTYQTHIIAPTYSPGLPLVMAVVEKAAGRAAVFYVVPVLGSVLIAASYLLGKHLASPWSGAVAAVLLVSSPTFLVMQVQVMSDVPVAAFWTVSFVAALQGKHPLLAGIAAGLAVMSRPNLAPLVLVPLLVLVRTPHRRRSILMCAIPIAVACAAVGALNWWYHGSPLRSGYGPLDRLFAWAHVVPNLRQYSRWFVELHTPLALLGAAAPLVARQDRARLAAMIIGLPVTLLAIYAPFLVFQPGEWTYTRFLLPGYVPWFAGVGMVITATVGRARWRRAALVIALALITTIAARGWAFAIAAGVFTQRSGEARYARAVEYARRLPERSILVSNAHSGTLRLYTGRDVLRFEAIGSEDLDLAVATLQRQGHPLFLIGDEFEIDQFRALFAGTRTAAALPPRPRADLQGVLVYELRP